MPCPLFLGLAVSLPPSGSPRRNPRGAPGATRLGPVLESPRLGQAAGSVASCPLEVAERTEAEPGPDTSMHAGLRSPRRLWEDDRLRAGP